MSKIDEKYFKEFVNATVHFLNTVGYKVQVYEGDEPENKAIVCCKDEIAHVIGNSKSSKEIESIIEEVDETIEEIEDEEEKTLYETADC